MRYSDGYSHQEWEQYIRRPPLEEEKIVLLRLRVALRIIDRLFTIVYPTVTEHAFPRFARRVILERRDAGFSHPLEEELLDVLRGWELGEQYAQTYIRALRIASFRVVNRVRTGGRRG